MSENGRIRVELKGEAKVTRLQTPLVPINISPSDLEGPLSMFDMISKIYEAMMKAMNETPKPRYMAEVKFTDALGTPVVFVIDLGEKFPQLERSRVKARIIVELYEDEEDPSSL